jgi:phosphate transport system substrate-binding protein
VAAVRNRAGSFVVPSVESVAAAMESVAATPADPVRSPLSLLDASSIAAYPIASFSWLVVPSAAPSPERARALAQFVRWATTEAGGRARELDYAPLRPAMAALVADRADSVLMRAPRR